MSWEQLVQSIYSENADDRFGWSAAISSDGTTLAVGSPCFGEMQERPGYVRTYSLNKSSQTQNWKQFGQIYLAKRSEICSNFLLPSQKIPRLS